jgi:hypothetical protein
VLERQQVLKMVHDLDLPSAAKHKGIDDFFGSTNAEMISYWRSESIDAALRYKKASLVMTAAGIERILFEPFSDGVGAVIERLMLLAVYCLCIRVALDQRARARLPDATVSLLLFAGIAVVFGTVIVQTASLSARNVIPMLPALAILSVAGLRPIVNAADEDA